MDFSKLWTMDKKDLVNTLGTLVFSSVIGTLFMLTQTPDFNFATIDWGRVVNMVIVAILTSVAKSSSTTSEGKLLGIAKVK